MVSKTIEDLPEPDTPVKMVILRFGIRSEMSLRLFSRAPRISMNSSTLHLSKALPPTRGTGHKEASAQLLSAGQSLSLHDGCAMTVARSWPRHTVKNITEPLLEELRAPLLVHSISQAQQRKLAGRVALQLPLSHHRLDLPRQPPFADARRHLWCRPIGLLSADHGAQ